MTVLCLVSVRMLVDGDLVEVDCIVELAEPTEPMELAEATEPTELAELAEATELAEARELADMAELDWAGAVGVLMLMLMLAAEDCIPAEDEAGAIGVLMPMLLIITLNTEEIIPSDFIVVLDATGPTGVLVVIPALIAEPVLIPLTRVVQEVE